MLENADLGKLIIRLTLGGLMLFHGIAKLLNGIGFIEGELASHGLPRRCQGSNDQQRCIMAV